MSFQRLQKASSGRPEDVPPDPPRPRGERPVSFAGLRALARVRREAEMAKHSDVIDGSWWVFPRIGVSQNAWFIKEDPIKLDDLGVSLFLETSIYFDGL